MSNKDKIAELQALDQHVSNGNSNSIDRQKSMGKLTARERIELLLDPNQKLSF